MRATGRGRQGLGVFVSAAVLFTAIAVSAEVRASPGPAEDLPATSRTSGETEDFGASCRTLVQGSRVTAYCQNPYPLADRVRLHVECERWWDVDADSAPVEVAPADYAQLGGRCWKEVRSAWITHQPADRPPSPAPALPAALPPAPVRGS
ncbi:MULTISPECIES: hypothetical protein [unclassified Streptomyces]|uniref:hypothetical protein n=1 Tax=unclassified Streptomyces TaxID=2593676 RepID=UPI0016614290|nr:MULTISPECIES: hypothetical protein [unclassified Streptomyces]MBD0709916.1 hypothetical protein [Streptomyces sp. CBMA291]MBD0716888.1 hypothetical protein [Streptomyces sp. CBMA370]